MLIYLALSEGTSRRMALISQCKNCYHRRYRFMVQGLVHSKRTSSASLPDTLIKTAQIKQLHSSIFASPQGNNISPIWMWHILNHFQRWWFIWINQPFLFCQLELILKWEKKRSHIVGCEEGQVLKCSIGLVILIPFQATINDYSNNLCLYVVAIPFLTVNHNLPNSHTPNPGGYIATGR